MKINYKQFLSILITCGVVIELFLIVFLLFNKDGNIPLFMFIYMEAFLLFFFVYFLISKLIKEKIIYTSVENKHGILQFILNLFARFIWFKDNDLEKLKVPLIIILFGILFRLTLFPSVPTTSNDVYRYVWEGKLIYHGFNPFVLQPNHPELNELRESIVYEKLTFKHIPAIYPPLSQAGFLTAYIISGESLWGFKLLYLICEIITMIFLLKILLHKKISLNYIFLYAWLPLVIMEFFINVHLDPLGIMFMVMFIYFFEKEKHLISAFMLALSFLAKLYPLMLLPLIIKKLRLKNLFLFISIFTAVTGIFYLPFITDNLSVFKALISYLSRWEFNGSVYTLLKFLINGEAARLICAILLIISIGIISIKYKNFGKASFGVFIAFIIFSTTLYPWYLGWLAALNPFAGFASAMSLFFTINFSNFTPLGDEWKEYRIVLLLEYIPFFLFLLYDLVKLKRKKEDG